MGKSMSICARQIDRAAPTSKIATLRIWGALALLSVLPWGPLWAQVTIPQEYENTSPRGTVGVLGTNLLGDTTNFYTGATEFAVTDVSLAGNSCLRCGGPPFRC